MKKLLELLSYLRPGRRDSAPPLRFDELFKRFRDVLDNNNRAIEIITDIGDKIGGDYLFDVTYLQRTYADLAEVMIAAIGQFDALTRNRYTALRGVYNMIDGRIRKLLYEDGLDHGANAVFFEDITWDMYRSVGGKGSHLAELKNALHAEVPEGFVITTHAFDEFMKLNGVDDRLASLKNNVATDEAWSGPIYDAVLNSKIPLSLHTSIENAVAKIKSRCGEDTKVSVRSSAEDEDGEHSFAGQFRTELNVSAQVEAIERAYRKVVASLFSEKAVSYQQRLGYPPGGLKMAVICMCMVDAEASGVIYTADPSGSEDEMIVSSAWGLGEAVVEAAVDADLFVISRRNPARTISEKLGSKGLVVSPVPGGGVETVEAAHDLQSRWSVSKEELTALAQKALMVEKYFRRPQDIEWARDKNGKVFLLQSRPLNMPEKDEAAAPTASSRSLTDVITLGKDGIVVQKGAGAGRVFVLKSMDEIETVPKGAVLVARNDSSSFVRLMPVVSAIITDIGTQTSHMASLCREFRVPTIVNAGNATSVLKHGQDITVSIEDRDKYSVYEGIETEILAHSEETSMKLEELYEYRRQRYILKFISPLNLIDPLMDNFSAEGCRTIHDILRFMHEKSVAELIESARSGALLKEHAAVKLELGIPTGIIAVDIGGGLEMHGGSDKASLDQITSLPLRALASGMTHPGAWHAEAVPLRVNDFMTSMIRMSDIVADGRDYVGYNVAVVSADYLNLSLRFGYHFNMIDCFCSENTRNNHIYFRFVGGATDLTKRSRRVTFLADILRTYGFGIKTKGDLIIGRITNINREQVLNIMDQMGRLIAFSRQLDAVLHSDDKILFYTEKFLSGDYSL